MKNKIINVLFFFLMIVLVSPFYACQVDQAKDFSSKLKVLSLEVVPAKAIYPEKVSVKATIKNIFNSSLNNYDVPLMIDGMADDRKFITISPGEEQSIEFSLVKEIGTYHLKIGNMQSTLEVRAPKPPSFQVSNLEITPTKCKISQQVVVTASITNIGELEGKYNAELKINGKAAQKSQINVQPEAKSDVVFKINPDVPGKYTLSVGDKESTLEVVAPVPATFRVGNLEIKPAKCKPSDNVVITADIANTGELEGKYNVQLKINGTTTQTSQINVTAGSISSVTFKFNPDSPGNFKVGIGDQESTLEVVAPIPATFKLSNLVIKPAECYSTDNVVVVFDIENTGELIGEYVGALKLNGVTVQTYEVNIPAGMKTFIVFKIPAGSPGKYTVSIGDISGQLTVLQAVQLPGVVCPPSQTFNPTTKC